MSAALTSLPSPRHLRVLQPAAPAIAPEIEAEPPEACEQLSPEAAQRLTQMLAQLESDRRAGRRARDVLSPLVLAKLAELEARTLGGRKGQELEQARQVLRVQRPQLVLRIREALAKQLGMAHAGDLPQDLLGYDAWILNTSAGKDSQAMMDEAVGLATVLGVRERLVAVHADLGEEEWPGTRELAEAQAVTYYGLRFEVVTRPQGSLLEHIEQRGKWPDAKNRYCTSDHKRGQVWRVQTALADEIRAAAAVFGRAFDPAQASLSGRTHLQHAMGRLYLAALLGREGLPEGPRAELPAGVLWSYATILGAAATMKWGPAGLPVTRLAGSGDVMPRAMAIGARSPRFRPFAERAYAASRRDDLAVAGALFLQAMRDLQAGGQPLAPGVPEVERFHRPPYDTPEVAPQLRWDLDPARAEAIRGGAAVRLLSCQGIRAQESRKRASDDPNEHEEGGSSGRKHVDKWLPLHKWTEARVWARLRTCEVPHHYAYDLGMPRLSCRLCVFAGLKSLLLSGKHNPGLLDKYVGAEGRMGHSFKNGFWLRDVRDQLLLGAPVESAAGEEWIM